MIFKTKASVFVATLLIALTSALPVQSKAKEAAPEKLGRQDILAHRAHQLLEVGKSNEGLESLLQACALPISRNADTQQRLVADLERAERADEAAKIVESVKKLEPRAANWMILKAFLNKEQGNFKEATDWYLKAASAPLWPDPQLVAYSAQDLHQMGRSKEALLVLDKFDAREKPVWYTGYFRGLALTELKRYEEARQYFRLALKKYPRGIEAIDCLSKVDLLLKDYPAVLKDTDAVSAISGYREHKVKIFADRGEACQALGRHDQAVQEFSKSLNLSESPRVFKKRAESYKKLGLHREAAADLKMAAGIDDAIKPFK